jgi:hypothetical protein
MRAGPVRDYGAPEYATREQALAEQSMRRLSSPSRLFRHPLGWALGLMVTAGTACAFGCVAVCPTVYMSEAEALDIIQDRFAAEGLVLERPGDGGPLELPFTPDLANWSLGVVVEYVAQDQCGDLDRVAEDLLARGEVLCGIEDTGELEDTGEPADEPPDPGWHQDLAVRCQPVADGDCSPWTDSEALGACLGYACFELYTLTLYDQECEWDQEWYLDNSIADFADRLRSVGVL